MHIQNKMIQSFKERALLIKLIQTGDTMKNYIVQMKILLML
jgi:hypothetical protein